MNYFDRLLEAQLREMLDPVVTQTPPGRRPRIRKPAEPVVVAIPQAPLEFAPEAISVVTGSTSLH